MQCLFLHTIFASKVVNFLIDFGVAKFLIRKDTYLYEFKYIFSNFGNHGVAKLLPNGFLVKMRNGANIAVSPVVVGGERGT